MFGLIVLARRRLRGEGPTSKGQDSKMGMMGSGLEDMDRARIGEEEAERKERDMG